MLAQICLFLCTPNGRYSWLLILHEYLIREEWSEIEREARKQLKADCTKWRPLNGESVYLIRDEERETEWVGERGRERQKRDILLRLTNQRGGYILKRFEGKQKWKKDRTRGEEHREGNNVHLWFWWKSSKRWGHLGWHIFTVQWMLVYLIVFHISLRLFVLHGPLKSLTTNLTTAKTSTHANAA